MLHWDSLLGEEPLSGVTGGVAVGPVAGDTGDTGDTGEFPAELLSSQERGGVSVSV